LVNLPPPTPLPPPAPPLLCVSSSPETPGPCPPPRTFGPRSGAGLGALARQGHRGTTTEGESVRGSRPANRHVCVVSPPFRTALQHVRACTFVGPFLCDRAVLFHAAHRIEWARDSESAMWSRNAARRPSTEDSGRPRSPREEEVGSRWSGEAHTIVFSGIQVATTSGGSASTRERAPARVVTYRLAENFSRRST